MNEPKQLHIYTNDAAVRSILHGIEISALCGRRKKLTRADADANTDAGLDVCAHCPAELAKESAHGDVFLPHRRGWMGILETFAKTKTSWTYQVTVSSTNATYTFPPAA